MILTRLQAVQIARQAQQHFDHDDRAHRYDRAHVYEYCARLMRKEGFDAVAVPGFIACVNSNATFTKVWQHGMKFFAEVGK